MVFKFLINLPALFQRQRLNMQIKNPKTIIIGKKFTTDFLDKIEIKISIVYTAHAATIMF